MSNKNENVIETKIVDVPVESAGENPVPPTVNENKNEKKSITRRAGEFLVNLANSKEEKRAAKKAEKEEAKAQGKLTKGQKIGLGFGIGAVIVGTIIAKEFVRAAMSAPDDEEETYALTEGEDISNEITDEISENNEET